MEIHTRQLRYFMELAKCLNFTKAAMNLYIAQPALSQQIAELEKQLGVTLFIRNSRSVSLTPAGQILLKSCPEIFAKLENTQKQMLLAQAGLRGNLKIGLLESFRLRLPDVLHQFTRLYPDIKTELNIQNMKELKTSLHDGSLDAAFAFINYRDMGEDAPSYTVLYQDIFSLAVRKDHPFVAGGCSDASLLKNETIFCLDNNAAPKYSAIVQEALSSLGFRSTRFAFSMDLKTILMQVDSGMGIAVVPSQLEALRHQNIHFLPLPDMVIDFGVLWMPQSQNAALSLFLDLVEKEFDPVPPK